MGLLYSVNESQYVDLRIILTLLSFRELNLSANSAHELCAYLAIEPAI